MGRAEDFAPHQFADGGYAHQRGGYQGQRFKDNAADWDNENAQNAQQEEKRAGGQGGNQPYHKADGGGLHQGRFHIFNVRREECYHQGGQSGHNQGHKDVTEPVAKKLADFAHEGGSFYVGAGRSIGDCGG